MTAAALQEFQKLALASRHDVFGADPDGNAITFTYKGTEYPCIASGSGRSIDLGIGGVADTLQLTLRVKKALAFTPVNEERLTFREREYRIKNVVDHALNAEWVLTLESATQ